MPVLLAELLPEAEPDAEPEPVPAPATVPASDADATEAPDAESDMCDECNVFSIMVSLKSDCSVVPVRLKVCSDDSRAYQCRDGETG